MNIDVAPAPARIAAPTPAAPKAAPQAVSPADTVSLSAEARAALEAPLRNEPPAQLAPWLLDTDLDGDLEVVQRLEARPPEPLAVVA